MTILITGATGHLGGAIVNALQQRRPISDFALGVHNVAHATQYQQAGFQLRQIDFQNEATLQQAFQDIDLLIYVPSKSHDSFSRVTELEHVINAAQASHVPHLLAMGFMADQANNPFDLSAFYGYLPRRLASSGLRYTILRNALYADPLAPYLPELIDRGHVIYPVGDQALSFISLADSAAAFATVATTPALLEDGRTYTLTQSQSYTMPALAKVLSTVSGHPINYEPVTLAEFDALYDAEHEGHMLASMYAGGAMGLLNEVTPDFETITGHPATDLTTFLQQEWSNKH